MGTIHTTHAPFSTMHKRIKPFYPAHTTHVYQGPDVVIFSVLKKNIGNKQQVYERLTGKHMTKENFLEIYSKAHLCTMTPKNIKMAFHKTGTWPVNPDIITPDMMALSKTTSWESHLPVQPPTPVRIVAKMLKDISSILLGDDLEPLDSDNNPSSSDVEVDTFLPDAKINPFIDTTNTCGSGPLQSMAVTSLNIYIC